MPFASRATRTLTADHISGQCQKKQLYLPVPQLKKKKTGTITFLKVFIYFECQSYKERGKDRNLLSASQDFCGSQWDRRQHCQLCHTKWSPIYHVFKSNILLPSNKAMQDYSRDFKVHNSLIMISIYGFI